MLLLTGQRGLRGCGILSDRELSRAILYGNLTADRTKETGARMM